MTVSNNNTSDTATYVGWLRQYRGRWREVCSADGWEECWQRLLAHQSGGKAVDRTVRLRKQGKP